MIQLAIGAVTTVICAAAGYMLGAWIYMYKAESRLYRLQDRIERRQQVLDTAIGLFRAEVQKQLAREEKKSRDV